jgi:RNA polymerase sigma-70 factor (ECF subfamily)
MYSWALHKTSSKETAEDLVQETFLAAVQSFDRFIGDSNPKTWLFSILNNKINDHYRNNYRKPTVDGNAIFEMPFDSDDKWKSDQRPQQWAEDTEHILDNVEFQKTLQNCMEKLPGNWYSAIQLKFMEEKNGEQICQELGITNTNFWQILHRAKLHLRKCIELNWFKE